MRIGERLVRMLLSLLSAGHRHAQDAKKSNPASDEPDLGITPNTIRIGPLERSGKEGQWVVMPGLRRAE